METKPTSRDTGKSQNSVNALFFAGNEYEEETNNNGECLPDTNIDNPIFDKLQK